MGGEVKGGYRGSRDKLKMGISSVGYFEAVYENSTNSDHGKVHLTDP